MSKVYILLYAHNNGAAVTNAINGILAQSYTDFTCSMVDNGSDDGGVTRALISAYGVYDQRLSTSCHDAALPFWQSEALAGIAKNISADDYFCLMPAGDTYQPNFLANMVSFMETNHLDMACCGSEIVGGGRRELRSALLLEGEKLADSLPVYFPFVRTVGNKLVKGSLLLSLLETIKTYDDFLIIYGEDTFFSLDALGSAERVGILAGAPHRSQPTKPPLAKAFFAGRVATDMRFQDTLLRFLKRFEPISEETNDFVLVNYLGLLIDTWHAIESAGLSDEETLNLLRAILRSPYTEGLLAQENFGHYASAAKNVQRDRIDLFVKLLVWSLMHASLWDDKDIEDAFTIALAMMKYDLKIELPASAPAAAKEVLAAASKAKKAESISGEATQAEESSL